MPLTPITLSTFDNGRVEAEFQKAQTKVRRALANERFKGTCKITVELTFKPGSTKNWVDATSIVRCSVPEVRTPNVLRLEQDELLMDTTSADARQPGLPFVDSDGGLHTTDD